jgi:hypothetical protein
VSGDAAPVRRVQLRDGGLVEVRLVEDAIVIGRVGGWTERVSRPEAWELAEAIDAMATTAGTWSDDAP